MKGKEAIPLVQILIILLPDSQVSHMESQEQTEASLSEVERQ